jgi:hypothetical protein
LKWVYGSIYDSIDKFASSFGYDNAGIALTMAMVPWDTPEDRDAFIESVTGRAPLGGD